MRSTFSRSDFYKLKYEPVYKKSFIKHINLERKKTKLYVRILYKEFNTFFNKDYPIDFWRAILDFFMLYHVSLCRGYYFTKNIINEKRKFIKYFRILDKKFYYVPKDISDYRKFFQNSLLGDEQYFSFFINFFFRNSKKKLFSNKDKDYFLYKSYIKKKKFFFFLIFKRFVNKILRYIINHKALITGCYWKESDKINISFYSLGKIFFQNYYIPNSNKKYDLNLRKEFFNKVIKSTRLSQFDRFCLGTLIFAIPISLFENLNYRIDYTKNFIKKNKNLKFIFNENLSEDNLLVIAISRMSSIKTIYLEHNTLQRQSLGNIIDLIKIKFDYYFTLGWKSKSKKLVPAGTNFKWYSEKYSVDKKIKYLFISDFPELNPPYLRSSYASSGVFNSELWYRNNILFFKNLSDKIKEEIIFKEYPDVDNYLLHNNYNKFINYISSKSKVKFFKKGNEKKITPKLISLSKLVVINHLSTSYIQSLLANVPTIIFCNYNYLYLEKNYRNFYKSLLKVNILHNNPRSAARFFNYLIKYNKVQDWWSSNETQLAKNNFLQKNINASDNLNKLILKTVSFG